MTEPRESEWQRVLNCVRTLTGKDMTVGEWLMPATRTLARSLRRSKS